MRRLLLSLFLFLPFIYSCKKTETASRNEFIREARKYFEEKILTDSKPSNESGHMQLGGKKEVKWEKANIQLLYDRDAVIIPISLPGLHASRDSDKVKLQADKNAFFIYRRDEKGNQQAEIYIKVPDEYSCETSFSGTVLVKDWYGRILRGFEYKNGLERQINITLTKPQNRPKTESLFDDCMLIDWWVCAQYGNYPVYCHVEYTTMECYTSGSSGGSAPGGWSPGSGPGGGTPGGISGGENQYPIGKLTQLIRFDTSIKTNLLTPCVKVVMDLLRDTDDGYGFWGKVIYDYFKIIPNFKWTLQIGTLPAGVNARTQALPPYSEGQVVTTVSTTYANACTDLSMARTLLHESIHAFLAVYFRQLQPTVGYTFPQMFENYQKTQDEMYASHEE